MMEETKEEIKLEVYGKRELACFCFFSFSSFTPDTMFLQKKKGCFAWLVL